MVVLRFANSLNADEPQPLARYLDLELVPTVIGFDPVMQLIDHDDCVEAMRLATLGGRSGAYNVAAPGPAPLGALLDTAGKLHAPLLPPYGLDVTSFALKQLGLAFLSPQLLDLLRWGRTLSTAKAERELGFRARLDTNQAFQRFVQDRRVLRFQPERQGYQYEQELEEFIRSRRPESDGHPQPLAANRERGAGSTRPRSRPRRSPARRR